MKVPACFDGPRVCLGASRLGTLALLLMVAGCFTYLPVEPLAVPQGRDVRVEMTRLGFAALPEIPGQSGPRLAGRVTGQDEEQLLLRVPVAVLLDGSEIGREIEIPTRDVVRVEVRELNRFRTGMLVATGIATGLALYFSFDKGSPTTAEREDDQEIEGDPGGLVWAPALISIRVP